LNVLDRRFKPWSGQDKDYEIGICCMQHQGERAKNNSTCIHYHHYHK
jgi:hypothetical protein